MSETRVAVIIGLVGLAMFAIGRRWRQGKLGRNDPIFGGRAILLEPIGVSSS